MTTKAKVGIAAVALLTAFAFGRVSAPVKVKTEVKTVEVEKKTDKVDTQRDKHQKTVITEVTKPDGTKEKTTTIIQDSSTDQKRTDSDSIAKTETQTKEVTRGSSPVTVSFLAGANLSTGPGPSTLVYGGAITHPVLGPVTIGIWGFTNATFGASLGLSF